MLKIGDVIVVLVSFAIALVVLNPRMIKWRAWRATVTPLASIIGSGFLVAGPILSHLAGSWAWVAILGLCAIGYFYGTAIRHNIRFVEPQLGRNAPRGLWFIEEISDLSLSLAYFVSVAYYLNLFAAFALRGGNIVDPFWIKMLATLMIGGIGCMGILRGLGALEKIETLAVGIKLSLIGGLCSTLAIVSMMAFSTGDFSWPVLEHTTGIAEAQVFLGLVILVQGFETSRYLGNEYEPELRITSMRWAQILSTAIYLIFILLVTRYFDNGLPQTGGETAIIDLLRPVGVLVAPLIIVTALASQLSAAVADMNGAGGLVAEIGKVRLPVKFGYAATAVAAIFITWVANIYEIITYASKAFVIYYGLQSLQAALSSARQKGAVRQLWAWFYGIGVVLALVIVIFAIPAEV